MSIQRRIATNASLLALALLISSPTLFAQLSTRATITGTVTDGSGAVVQSATVTITDDATKVAVQTESNRDGAYIEPDLAPSTARFAELRPRARIQRALFRRLRKGAPHGGPVSYTHLDVYKRQCQHNLEHFSLCSG